MYCFRPGAESGESEPHSLTELRSREGETIMKVKKAKKKQTTKNLSHAILEGKSVTMIRTEIGRLGLGGWRQCLGRR